MVHFGRRARREEREEGRENVGGGESEARGDTRLDVDFLTDRWLGRWMSKMTRGFQGRLRPDGAVWLDSPGCWAHSVVLQASKPFLRGADGAESLSPRVPRPVKATSRRPLRPRVSNEKARTARTAVRPIERGIHAWD